MKKPKGHGQSVMYKLFCMHPVVGREKEAYPASATATTHTYASLTFAIFSSLSTLCKITPSYACLWNGRASVMLSAATLWATSHMQFTDHTLTTVSPYVGGGGAIVKNGGRKKKNKSSEARGKRKEHLLFFFGLVRPTPRHFPSRN